ncbi:MAG: hypothetical protein M1828_000429 [Chrysothrix sp. TS-e1954]|nr:MAG: hypothetical protein M1828_000429 [Chrysothrix sp. TS-e1954]
MAIAKELDMERAQGKSRGPLHGVPILIKNNIATDDKMNNTAGSFALLGAKVPRDSTIAANLRKAGVIILGKANLSQWANFRSNHTSNGWSAYGGQCKGAYFPDQDPSGSSSGPGVSSSIGLALAALGSEVRSPSMDTLNSEQTLTAAQTDGSILSPSEVNNLVGIKPTVGLTSRYLVIPISATQDTVGPMARSVKDAAYLLQTIAGPDPKDNYTLASPFLKSGQPDYVGACNFSSLGGSRFGVPRNAIELFMSDTSGPVLQAFESSLDVIRKAGGTVVDANFTALEAFSNSADVCLLPNNETNVLGSEFITGIAEYFAELTYNPNNITSLTELRTFTEQFPAEDFPQRDVAIWTDALKAGFDATSIQHYEAVQADKYLGGPGGLLGALSRNNLDAMLLPTQFAPSFAAIVGAPGVSVPMGFYPPDQPIMMNSFGNLVATGPNIPFGLSFLGRRWSETSLISYAYAFEQRTMVRNKVQPYLVPNTELADVLSKNSTKPYARL